MTQEAELRGERKNWGCGLIAELFWKTAPITEVHAVKYVSPPLNSAKQNLASAYATGYFSATPAKAVRHTLRHAPP
jgi:hypothetical protein